MLPSNKQIEEITNILASDNNLVFKTSGVSDCLKTFTPMTYVHLYNLLNESQ